MLSSESFITADLCCLFVVEIRLYWISLLSIQKFNPVEWFCSLDLWKLCFSEIFVHKVFFLKYPIFSTCFSQFTLRLFEHIPAWIRAVLIIRHNTKCECFIKEILIHLIIDSALLCEKCNMMQYNDKCTLLES